MMNNQRKEGVIALTAATRQEISSLCRCVILQPCVSGDGYHAWTGRYKEKDVLIIQSGVGREKAESAMSAVLESRPISALISLGFAGGLTEELKAGSVMLCDDIRCVDSGAEGLFLTDTELMRCATKAMESTNLHWLKGSGFTVLEAVLHAEEKRKLGEHCYAQVVEMEDYWIAHIAAAKEIPFLAVRVVFDDVNSHLLDIDRICDEWGNIGLRRMILFFLTQPRHLWHAPAFYWSFRRAQTSLAKVTRTLLEVL